jgi:hypothetical protein
MLHRNAMQAPEDGPEKISGPPVFLEAPDGTPRRPKT